MFRTTKKKRSHSSTQRVRLLDTTSDNEDSNNDHDENHLNVAHKSKKSAFQRTIKKIAFLNDVGGDDNDDNETTDLTVAQRKKKLDRTKRSNNSKQKKKTRGLGFGGGFVHSNDDDDDGSDIEKVPDTSARQLQAQQQQPTTSGYDKDTLAALLGEQKSQVRPQQSAADQPSLKELDQKYQQHEPTAPSLSSSSKVPSHNNKNDAVAAQLRHAMDRNSKEDFNKDFLAFEPTVRRNENTHDEADILTGEEALMFEQRLLQSVPVKYDGYTLGDNDDDEYQVQRFLESSATGQNIETEEAIGDENWETEVTRRAGVFSSGSNTIHRSGTVSASLPPTTNHDREPHSEPSADGSSSLVVLNQLRTHIRETLQNLKDQDEDLERRIQRRTSEIDGHTQNARQQETEIAQKKMAKEFYQTWRNELVSWVGAIRELQSKVEPIVSAQHELACDVAAVSRWRDWENDVTAVLQEHGMLEQVIGRQPPLPKPVPVSESIAVDEFGRDVKSRHCLQREKRRNQRRRIRQQRQNATHSLTDGSLIQDHFDTVSSRNVHSEFIRGDESDAFISEGEQETLRERHEALGKALALAMDDIHEQYTTLHNLVSHFEKWHAAFPVEFTQSFASLSLADLVGILVQAELCALNNPWDESGGYNEAKWTAVVHTALQQGTLDQAAVERLFKKWVFPVIADLLDKRGINLISSRQTRSLSQFMSHIQKLLPSESPVWTPLRESVTAFIAHSLADLTIPILQKTATPAPKSKRNDDVDEARYAATWGQLHCIKKLLLNLMQYWAPLMLHEMEFCDLILHFVSNNLLLLLSSMNGNIENGLAETPSEVFQDIFLALSRTGWLDYPEFMMQATLIRGASLAYQPKST